MLLSDPLTKESFVPKRSNQKFSCRLNQIKYNNRKAKSKRLAKAPYDKILDTNRNILIRIIGEEDDCVFLDVSVSPTIFRYRIFQRYFQAGYLRLLLR